MRLPLPAVVLLVGFACTTGCGGDPAPSSPSSPTPTPAPAPAPAAPAPAKLDALVIAGSVQGGASSQGTVRLTAAAPAGGFEVRLSPDDTLLTMPATVRVAEGASSSDFAITTREFDTDTAIPVHVTATGGGETRVVTVNVLPRPLRSLSTVFSFQSPSGDYVGNGQNRSFDTSNANFFGAVSCEYGAIDIWLNQGAYEWNLRFAAPYGTPLRPGTYSNAARQAFQPAGSPGLDVGGEGRGCNRIFGSFTVTDAVYSVSGQIRRFRATFEQRCELPTRPALTGEVSVSDLSSHRNVYVFCPTRSLLSALR